MEELGASFTGTFTFFIVYVGGIFPINIFLPTESLFILAGIKGATSNDWSLAIIIYLAIFLGDQTSYWIGRLGGNKVLRRVKSRKLKRFMARGKLLISTYGARFIFFSRFLGPIAWISDVSAGTYKLNYYRYFIASTCGSFLAVGGFLVFGYLTGKGIIIFGFGKLWNNFENFIENNWIVLLLAFFTIALLTWIIKLQFDKRAAQKEKLENIVK